MEFDNSCCWDGGGEEREETQSCYRQEVLLVSQQKSLSLQALLIKFPLAFRNHRGISHSDGNHVENTAHAGAGGQHVNGLGGTD